MNNYNTKILKNGATLITIPMNSTKACTIILFFGTGSRYEQSNISGYSHLFEHLLFKGTETKPTPKEIAEIVESKGGILNAYTDRESTGYWCKVPSTICEQGIELLIDMAKNPLLREKDLEVEKQVVFEEIKASLDSPDSRASMKAESYLWPNQPMGRDVAGSIKTVKATSIEDLKKYLDQQYTASNCILVVSGNFDEQTVKSVAERNFEDFRQGAPSAYLPAKYIEDGPTIAFDKMETNQAHITMIMGGLNMTDRDKYALSLVSIILGGGMTSRLFEQVREKRGLAYSVYSHSSNYSDCGAFYIDAGVSFEKIEESLKVIVEEINNMRENVSEFELRNAKELIKGRMMMSFEDSRAVAMSYGLQQLLIREIVTEDQAVKKIEKVNLNDLKRVMSRIFTNKKTVIAIAGPIEENQDLTGIIKF